MSCAGIAISTRVLAPAVSMSLFLISLATTVSLALLGFRKSRLRGTTLVAGWWWAVVSISALGITLICLHGTDQSGKVAEPARFAAAVGTFCPLMSLLGAKRPQHRAWNFIVLSLWIVLALPAAQAVFLHRGQTMEIHATRGWFLWSLIGLGILNHLPTRFWLSAIFVAGGQCVLLWDHLPLLPAGLVSSRDETGTAAFAAAILFASWNWRSKSSDASSLDQVWLDFRDSFGTFWGLRVVQRFNADALVAGWTVSLGWSGFRVNGGFRSIDELPVSTRNAVQQSLHNLLRRFLADDRIVSEPNESVD